MILFPKDKKELLIKDANFKIHKFNNKEKSDCPLFISCFSEFGCELVGVQYTIPYILQKKRPKYSIAVGWYGREYLYRHLVDEYWEISENHQWLREYCRAFHHTSNNLKRIENSLTNFGDVIASKTVGEYTVGVSCQCGSFWGDISKNPICKKCQNTNIIPSIFGDTDYWRDKITPVPLPKKEVNLKPNSVGIFARGRKCYGRNLQPEFYVNLISLLREMGYEPVWLGEKQTIQSCPVKDIIDFSVMPQAADLEFILAVISQLKFTVQFWTASTRLASLVRTPYLLFESSDQIWGNGQEGIRRRLCDFGKTKLVVAHYKNIYDNNVKGLDLVRQAVQEMEIDNYNDIVEKEEIA